MENFGEMENFCCNDSIEITNGYVNNEEIKGRYENYNFRKNLKISVENYNYLKRTQNLNQRSKIVKKYFC